MNQSAHTWIVVPTFNEAQSVPGIVRQLVALGYRVVVVDDGSTDDTRKLLENTGALVVGHVVNLGQGAALQTGICCALQRGARYVVTFDADGQHDAEEISRMVEPLASGLWEVSLGTRFGRGGRAIDIPASKRLLLRIATFVTRMTTRLSLTDTHNGFRAFTASAASRLNITQNRMSHGSQILSQIASLRLRYGEVPVTIRYTAYSRTKGQKLSNAFNIVWENLLDYLGL